MCNLEPHRERFMAFVYHCPNTGCWYWGGSTSGEGDAPGRGYGKFKCFGASLMAHRVSYELHKRPIRKGMTIDHKCQNRLCVNPDHLQQVTNKENSRRRSRRNGKYH